MSETQTDIIAIASQILQERRDLFEALVPFDKATDIDTLTLEGRTFALGQGVRTPYGLGSIFAFDAENLLPIGVQVTRQGEWGSKFWFAVREVTPVQTQGTSDDHTA